VTVMDLRATTAVMTAVTVTAVTKKSRDVGDEEE